MMPGYMRRPAQIPDRLRIQRQPFALHIGLVWASGVDNKEMYEDKSMALEPLMGLFDRWRQERFVVIHSLQVGTDASQLDPWCSERGVVDHSEQIGDFLDTACLISQLDLVISVDTAVAHLAGALDVPVWTLLQHNADFRWMRGRRDSLVPIHDFDASNQARRLGWRARTDSATSDLFARERRMNPVCPAWPPRLMMSVVGNGPIPTVNASECSAAMVASVLFLLLGWKNRSPPWWIFLMRDFNN